MAKQIRFLNEVEKCNEVNAGGFLFRFKYNEVRRKLGQYWVLVARKCCCGKWEIIDIKTLQEVMG